MGQATKLLKHSSIYAVGNISRQLIGFLMLPVYTTYLTPADYGVVGLLIFMVSLIELLFGGHMFHAIPKFYFDQESQKERNCLLSTALIVTTLTSIVTVFFVALFSNPASTLLFGTAEYALLVCMFAVQILTNALENYALVYLRIQQKPLLFVAVNFAKLALQLSLNIIFVVYLEKGVLGVAISSMLSSILFATIMTIYTLAKVGLNYSKEVTLKLLKFSWPLWVGGIAGLYIGSANRYYIRLFSSLDDVGLFTLAAKFGSIIFLLIWTPFGQYWQTERYNIYRQKNALPIFQLVYTTISTLLIIVALGVALFSDPVIRIMAAEAFHPASLAVPFLALGGVFQCLVTYNNFSFLVKEKTAWMSRNSYLTAGVITIFYLLLIPSFGFVGAAAAALGANFVQFLVVFTAAKKHFDMQLKLQPLFRSISIAVAAFFLAWFFKSGHLLVDIGINLLIYIPAAILLLYPLTRLPQTKHFLGVFTQRFRRKSTN